MFFARKQLRQARQLIRQGDLNRACRVTRQVDFSGSSVGRRIANQLIDRLVIRAGQSSVSGDLQASWRDLSDASSMAVDQNRDRVAKLTTKLVDQTIGYAQTMLIEGKPANADSAIGLLSNRNIQDRRADELKNVCDMILQADDLAANGRLADASNLLTRTKELRPELTFLDSRIRNFGYQATQLAELTNELRFAINQSAWNGAEQVSNQILQIAPKNQVALDARRRSVTKQDNATNSIVWIKDDQRPATGGIHHECDDIVEVAMECPQDQTNPETNDLNDRSIKDNSTCYGHSTASGNRPSTDAQVVNTYETENKASGPMHSFILWIDGIGGFLVCANPTVTIGRAVPNAGIDIPVQADLRRHHLKIKRVEDQYLASSPGVIESGDQDGSDWTLLGDQQKIELGSGVSAMFTQTHPLGRSARLEFTSRHRTEPWSDAVLLLGDAILLGPERANHVCCPDWKDPVVIYRKGDEIYLRAHGDVQIDGIVQSGDVQLKDGTRVVGKEFSISCEQVGGSEGRMP